MLEDLRQFFKYSKEIRIAAPLKSDSNESLEALVNLLKSLSADTDIATSQGALLQLTKETSTTVWRLERRLASDGEASEIIGRASRDLQSVSDALRQAGVETRDHTGEKYDGGMALKVLAFQPISGLSEAQIVETIKPTIYYGGRMAQMGEVIVGVPENADKSPEAAR